MFYNKAKDTAITRLQFVERKYNTLGILTNDKAIELYNARKSAAAQISRVETFINTLANSPKEFAKEVREVQTTLREFRQAVEIEKANSSNNLNGGKVAGGGIAIGGAIAALGPSAAMAIATTFGTASTGTAISTLSGAVATKAALAWLGGGALSAGGGGIAAGNAMLALAGPIGWTVAGALAIGGGAFAAWKNRAAAIEATKRTVETEKRRAELNIRYKKLQSLLSETIKLKKSLSISLFVNTFPKDYIDFSTEQKEKLAALINNVRSMGILINERIS